MGISLSEKQLKNVAMIRLNGIYLEKYSCSYKWFW